VAAVSIGAATAAALDAAEALDVDPDELARMERRVRPEAPRRLGEDVTQSVDPVPAEDPVDRARMEPKRRPDPVGADALVHPQRHHRALEGRR